MSKQRMKVLIPGLAVFAIGFMVYIATLCPSVYTGDSGEFITTSHVLGIAHPPGYPLYSLLGKLFTFIPVASIAWRVNLMSAFFAALAVMLIYFVVHELTGGIPASFISALAMAFTSTLWSQAVTAEVYTLNAFFMILTFYILLKWRRDRGVKWLYLIAFLIGLGMTNHYIMMLFIPVYAFFVWAETRRKEFSIIELLKTKGYALLLFFIIGFSFYFFLMVRSGANPPIDWGNTETLGNFLKHVKRIQYKAMEFGSKTAIQTKLSFTLHLFMQTFKQFSVFVVWISLLGLGVLFKRDRKILATTFLIYLINSVGLIFLLNFPYTAQSRFVVEVYYIPAYMMLSIWIGIGIDLLVRKLKKYSVVLLLIPCLPFAFNVSESSRANYHLAYDYGMNILKTLDRNATYFCSGDNQMFILAYLKMAEGKRKDVTVYTDTGFVFENIYGTDSIYLPNRNVRNAVQKRILAESRVPVYFALGSNMSNFPAVPHRTAGITYRVMRNGESLNNEEIWNKYSLRGVGAAAVYKDYLNRGIECQYYYFQGEQAFLSGDEDKAYTKFEKAVLNGHDIPWVQNNVSAFYNIKGNHENVIKLSKKVIEADGESSDAYANLGHALSRKNRNDEAIEAIKKSIELDPRNSSAYMKLAGIYLAKKDFDKSLESYSEVIRINPKSTEAYMGIGGIYFNRGKMDEALDFYRKAVAIDNYSYDAHNNLGVAYERKGMADEAIKSYETAAKIQPNKPDSHYNLGVVYWKLEKWELVVKEFEEALRIDPGYEKPKKFLPRARERLRREKK